MVDYNTQDTGDTGTTGGNDYFSIIRNQMSADAANRTAQIAYQNSRLALEGSQFNFMSQMEKDKFAQQKANDAWNQAFQQSQADINANYRQAEADRSYQLSRQQMGQQNEQFMANLGLGQQNFGLQQELGRGNLALNQEMGRGNLQLSQLAQSQNYQLASQGQVAQNIQATRGLDIQAANQRAQEAYQKAQIDLEYYKFGNVSASQKEEYALQKAQQAFNEEIGRSQMTGYTPGGAPTLARQGQEQQTGLGLMNIASQLRGPANAFQYAKTLQSTPQGMKDIIDAVAGKYTMSGFGRQTGQATPASLNTMVSDITGQPAPAGNIQNQQYGGFTPVGQTGQPGSNQGYTGQPELASGLQPQISQMYTGPQDTQAALAATENMPLASQWNAANYAKMTPTQRDLLYGAYEYQGQRPEDVQATFKASLPQYKAPTAGRLRLM